MSGTRDETTDVVVIGAGMAGVSAARALASGGMDVVVLESRSRVGGRLHTLRDFCSAPVEAGAEFVHGAGAATWGDLRSAGLRTVPTPYSRTFMRLGGKRRWLPLHLLDPGVWRSFDILWALGHRKGPDVSGAEFIEAKGYRGKAAELARLTLTAHLPGAVDEVGVAGLVADGVLHLESGVNHRVLEGYDSLARHIATGLELRLDWRVAEVSWADDGVEVVAADGTRIRGRCAVSTLPHGVLAAGAVAFSPELPPARTAAIDSIRSGSVTKVLIRFEERFWSRHMTQLVCGDGPVTLYWPTSYGTDGPAVLSGYATGPRATALSEVGEASATQMVLDDLTTLYPSAPISRLVMDTRFVDWSSDPDSCGGYTFLPPGAVGAREALRAADTGALFWAGSATHWTPVADTVEAAYLSGLRAARQVSAHLRN